MATGPEMVVRVCDGGLVGWRGGQLDLVLSPANLLACCFEISRKGVCVNVRVLCASALLKSH